MHIIKVSGGWKKNDRVEKVLLLDGCGRKVLLCYNLPLQNMVVYICINVPVDDN